MAEILAWAERIAALSGAGILALAVLAFICGWIVPRWLYDRESKRADSWQELYDRERKYNDEKVQEEIAPHRARRRGSPS